MVAANLIGSEYALAIALEVSQDAQRFSQFFAGRNHNCQLWEQTIGNLAQMYCCKYFVRGSHKYFVRSCCKFIVHGDYKCFVRSYRKVAQFRCLWDYVNTSSGITTSHSSHRRCA